MPHCKAGAGLAFQQKRRQVRIVAIRAGELYVFTHPEFQPLIEDRFAKVVAALERAKEPVKAG